jgi:YteA family regulatory protein
MLNQDKLQYYSQRLQSERNKEREMLSHIEESLQGEGQQDTLAELSVYDNHPADIGTETFERSKDIGLRDRSLVRLEKIDDALARVAGGTYGTCRHCGQEISEERLEAVPETVLCLACQEAEDARDRDRVRPVEEQVVSMPFGREWQDGRHRQDQRDGRDRQDGRDEDDRRDGDDRSDGEEFWFDVARYGTSSDTVRHDEEEHTRDADSVEDMPYRRGRDGVSY